MRTVCSPMRLYPNSAEVGQLSSPLQVSLRQGAKLGSSFTALSEREISTTFAGRSSLPIVASWGSEARKFGLSFSHCNHPAVVMGTPWAPVFQVEGLSFDLIGIQPEIQVAAARRRPLRQRD